MRLSELYKVFKESTGVSIDTRSIKKGELFFALSGPNFNGNSFAEEALRKGASYAVCDDSRYCISSRHILVNDTLKTLQDLSTFHRQHLKATIIAITGSNGKTTNKELLYSILNTTYKTDYTKGNLNNHIGVPLTLLRTSIDKEYLVLEMGANHQKEIAALCEIAHPDFGMITNIGKAHLEGFGGIEGVKKGKGELYEYLANNDKTAFVQDYDETLNGMTQPSLNVVYISRNDIDLVSNSSYIELVYNQKTIRSHLTGSYNATNIIQAIRIAEYFNVSLDKINKGVYNYVPDNNRSQISKVGSATFVLDAYNANPSSMKVALTHFFESFSQNANEKILILGDMLELGESTIDEHRSIIDLVKESGIEAHFIGPNFNQLSQHRQQLYFWHSTQEFIEKFNFESITNRWIFMKGSRGLALEKIYQFYSHKINQSLT